MTTWSFPGTVTEVLSGGTLVATLDLGMRLRYPALIRLAGIRAAKLSTAEGRDDRDTLAELLPAGARIQVIAGRLTERPDVTGVVLTEDGRSVVDVLRDKTTPVPTWQYGGTLDKTWRYPASVVSTHDGDSVTARVDPGCYPFVLAPIRVGHVNAPELATPEGKLARDWAQRTLPPGTKIDILSRTLDKYGRLLGDIQINGADYATQMLAAGHCVPYEC